MISNIREVRSRGAKVIHLITNADAQVEASLSDPLIMLFKSVTVE